MCAQRQVQSHARPQQTMQTAPHGSEMTGLPLSPPRPPPSPPPPPPSPPQAPPQPDPLAAAVLEIISDSTLSPAAAAQRLDATGNAWDFFRSSSRSSAVVAQALAVPTPRLRHGNGDDGEFLRRVGLLLSLRGGLLRECVWAQLDLIVARATAAGGGVRVGRGAAPEMGGRKHAGGRGGGDRRRYI